MKTRNLIYEARLSSTIKKPRVTIAISFDLDDTDIIYFTSHPDAKYPDGATVISDCLENGSLSNQSQTLDVETATSTIGQLTFNLIDIGGAISTIMGSKELAGDGLRHKRVVIHSGFEDLEWADYEVESTYIIAGINQEEGLYKFSCSDVNRLVRAQVFDVHISNILTTVPVSEKTFSVSVTDFVAATKELTIVDGDYNAQDFYPGLSFEVTGSSSNNNSFTVDTIESETKLTVLEIVIDESISSAIASHVLRIKITGADLTKFPPVEHDSTYRYWPSDTVGLIKLDNELFLHDGPENDPTVGYSIAIRENGRGVIDTPIEAHEVDSGVSDSGRNPEVVEVVYIEGPAPKIALAVLTGTLYGQGATLPDHWNCNIAAKYIRTADFISIGSDIWDTVSGSGRSLQFFTTEKVAGKQFIESQIMRWLGCFMPIYSDGALGLKKLPTMLSLSGYVKTIDDSVTYKRDILKRVMTKVINQVTVNWGKVTLEDKYTKINYLVDADSISKHQLAGHKSFKLEGVKTGKNTDEDLINYFNVWRDLYSAPPYEVSLTVLHSMLNIEVGDAIRVKLPQHKDIIKNTSFDRVMMVTSANSNPMTGDVKLSLIGPSTKPTPLTPPSATTKLDPGYYSPIAPATELGALAVAQGTSIVAGVLQGDITLTGSDDMNSLDSVFYYAGDLEIPTGVTVTIFDNVNIRMKGHLAIVGSIVSSGSTNYGGNGERLITTATDFVATTKTITVVNYADNFGVGFGITITSGANTGNYTVASIPDPTHIVVNEVLVDESLVSVELKAYTDNDNSGTQDWEENYAGAGVSGFGSSIGEGGIDVIIPFFTFGTPYDIVQNRDSKVTPSSDGIGEFSRFLSLEVNGAEISGVPHKFSGTGGSGGTGIRDVQTFFLGYEPTYSFESYGGDGGDGGAGLLVVCQGASFGGAGIIDLTGEDGTPASSFVSEGKTLYAGAGTGGVPGACYFLYDGTYTVPNLDGKVVSQLGNTPSQGLPIYESLVALTEVVVWWIIPVSKLSPETVSSNVGSQDFIYSEEDAYFQYLPEDQTPEDVTPNYTSIPLAISAIEIVNTPASALGTLSTIEITVTKPSDTSYSYANVYYRKLGDIEWNFLNPSAASGPTSKVIQIVDSDGSTWEYLALSVSLAGNELEAGKQTSIQTTNVVDAPSSDPDLPTWLPLATPQTLQLVGGGAVFNGRSPQITWSYDGTANPPPQHFDYYKIEIYSAAGADVLRRTVKSTDPWFEYTEEMGIEAGGPYREIRFDITSVGLKGHESSTTTATYTNPQSGLPAATEVIPSFAAIEFGYTKPADNDWKGILVYLSEVNGFTANASTLVYEGSDTAVHLTQFANGGVLAPVEPGTIYYLRYQTYDAFDQIGMTLSAQQSVLIQSVNVADIDGLSNWATQIALVDSTFIAANMDASAISSTQIASLVAGKIAAGTISSEITISGLFRTSATGFRVDMGPVVDGADTFVFRYHDGLGNDRFSIDDAGNVAMDQATLTAAGITGGIIQTASGTGERVVMSDTNNKLVVYSAANSIVASIGKTAVSGGDTALYASNGATASYAALINSNSQSHPALWVVNESQPTIPVMQISTDTYTDHALDIEFRDKAIRIVPNPGLGVGNGDDDVVILHSPLTTDKAALYIENTANGISRGVEVKYNGGIGMVIYPTDPTFFEGAHLWLVGRGGTDVPIHNYLDDGVTRVWPGSITANTDGRLFSRVKDVTGGSISSSNLWAEISTLGGKHQSWQNVLASRALGVTYTNNTCSPIQVNVTGRTAQWGGSLNLIVDGVTVHLDSNDSNDAYAYAYMSVTAIIPVGSTYSCTGTALVYWAELR